MNNTSNTPQSSPLPQYSSLPGLEKNDKKISKKDSKISDSAKILKSSPKKESATSILQVKGFSVIEDSEVSDIAQKNFKSENDHSVDSSFLSTSQKLVSSKSSVPNLEEIFRVLDPDKVVSGQVSSSEIDAILIRLKNSQALQKSEISYALMELHQKKIRQLTYKCNLIKEKEGPVPAEEMFKEGMLKLGYINRPVVIKKEGIEEKVSVWEKPHQPLLITMQRINFINENVVPRILSEEGRSQPDYFLRSSDKICVSYSLNDEAYLWQAQSRAGMILEASPSSILETFAIDRYSPCGYRKSEEEIHKMTLVEKQEYEANMESIDNFIAFIKRYKGLCTAATSIGTAIACAILLKDEMENDMSKKLTPDEKKSINNFIVGLEEFQKEAIKNAGSESHEQNPPLIQYLDYLYDLTNKYISEDDDTELHHLIFTTSQDHGTSLSIVDDIKNFRDKMTIFFDNAPLWQDVNIHPYALKWKPELKNYQKRLLPLQMYGPSTLLR